jgi:hypothetical protein
MVFETLKVRREGGVLFAYIKAPPKIVCLAVFITGSPNRDAFLVPPSRCAAQRREQRRAISGLGLVR